MKNKKRIYDRQELINLVNKEHSCIILKHCNRKIELQAKYLKDVKLGIKEALDTGLNKFDYSLNGILLDYQNLNVLMDQWSGRIVGRFGEFIVTINAEFFIFDPKIGSLLEGVVNAKSDTHVGCLVHKRFNAMILKPDVEDNWNCKNIQIGDKIIFTIVDHVFSSNIPHIEGVLATENIEKSSKTSKKTSKVLGSTTHDSIQNGKFSDGQDVFAQDDKKTNKVDEVDSSDQSTRKQENDLDEILGNKPQKPKSKKRGIDKVDDLLHNMMDEEDSFFVVKKNKKIKRKLKEKEIGQSETIQETEKPLEPLSACLTHGENPAPVLNETVASMNDIKSVQVKHKKKKRNKEELESSENVVGLKKKKKKNKKDSECIENVSLETAEGKKTTLDTVKVEELIPTLKKKKKNEKKTLHVKTPEQCELSRTNKNRLCLEENNELNVSPADLIDQLMNVVPTDILPVEATPVKGTSLESLKSPRSPQKSETPEKNRSTNKKKREESFSGSTSGFKLDVDIPSKKRPFNESIKLPKSVKPQDKSLFSDSEASTHSPLKQSPETVVPFIDLSQTKSGGTSGKNKGVEAPVVLVEDITPKLNSNKKERKHKKGENWPKSEENQRKKKTVEEGDQLSIISKMPLPAPSKKEKKDSRNKSVEEEGEKLSPVGGFKTTLLQGFERCLNYNLTSQAAPYNEIEKANPKKKKEKKVFEVKEKKSNKSPAAKEKLDKTHVKEGEEKTKKNLKLSSVPKMVHESKVLSLEGVDDTQLSNPVKTSTPKIMLSKIDASNGKGKKSRTTKVKKPSGDDDERSVIIKALLKQAKESIGMDNLIMDPTEKSKVV